MVTSSDSALLDTNVLIHAMNRAAEHHADCRALRDRALARTLRVCLAPQVLFEYYAVVTSPSLIASPLTLQEALSDVEKLAAVFPLVHPPPDLHARVFQLIRETGFSSRHVFDLSLAATMIANGVRCIYTYDERFAHIAGIERIVPPAVGSFTMG